MLNNAIEMQARVIVYDLNNTAREFGFKPDEGWQLNAVSQEDKTDLEKRYHPTITNKVMPEILAELFGMVNDALVQTRSEIKNNLTPGDPGLNYLVAFNPKRPRY